MTAPAERALVRRRSRKLGIALTGLVLCSPLFACATVYWMPASDETRPAKAPGTVPLLWFGPADRPVRELGVLSATGPWYGPAVAILMKEAARLGCDAVGGLRERHAVHWGWEADDFCDRQFTGDCPPKRTSDVALRVVARCLVWEQACRPACYDPPVRRLRRAR